MEFIIFGMLKGLTFAKSISKKLILEETLGKERARKLRGNTQLFVSVFQRHFSDAKG